MRKSLERRLQFILWVLVFAIAILFVDFIICMAVMYKSSDINYTDASEIMEGLSYNTGEYVLSDEESTQLQKNNEFAFLLDSTGNITWSENMPESLKKSKYTLQDVAKFTRYYLDDCPVRTYIVSEDRLLIVGKLNADIWKYTLEYDANNVLTFLEITPVLFIFNIILFIFVSIRMYKARQRRIEEERVEWIAGVSHDIRTPLAVILGNAQMIPKESGMDEIKRKSEIIESQGLRIRALVENLNITSKLDFGTKRFEKSKVCLSTLIRKIVSNMINSLDIDAQSKYDFELNIDDELQKIEVSLNEELFERAVINLLNNTFRHNPDGCSIYINLYKETKKTVLEIGDGGSGVPEEILQRLNQNAYAETKSVGRHGLGLKIVKKVAAFHRWKVRFTNGENAGFVCRMEIK